MKMSQSLVRWTAAVVHCAARCTILWYCSRWRCGLHPPPPHTDGGNSRTNRTNSQIGHALHHTESNRRGGAGIPRVTRGNYSTIGWSDSAFFGQFLKPTIAIYLNFVVVVKFFLLLQRTLAKLKIRNTFLKIYF